MKWVGYSLSSLRDYHQIPVALGVLARSNVQKSLILACSTDSVDLGIAAGEDARTPGTF